MKVTVNGLKQYVDFDWSLKELIENLTMLGLEVEGVEKIGGGYEGIVVAEVIESKPHPDADKLRSVRFMMARDSDRLSVGPRISKWETKFP